MNNVRRVLISAAIVLSFGVVEASAGSILGLIEIGGSKDKTGEEPLVKVPGVVSIGTSGGSAKIDLLGGGGTGIGANVGSTSVNLNLPGLGGGGTGGGTGGPQVTYYGGSNAGSAGADGLTGKLRMLFEILLARDYLQVARGQRICLDAFGTASVSGWVPQRDWAELQGVLSQFSGDIYALRQMLANCRSQQLALTELNRVIAIDIGADGRPILFLL
jgi:hypothetical protein